MLEQHAGDGRRQNLPAPSIQFIAPEGMPYMRHMHTDLMRAARENPYPKQAVALPLVQHAPLAAGFLAVFRHRNLDLHRGMPAERRIHRARRRGDPLHQRKVFLPYFPCRERLGKPHPRLFRERHADKPGGVLVQPMHDAGPKAFLRPQGRETRHQPMDERPIRAARRGVYGHTRRFVEHGKPRILIEDLQFALFRLHGCRFRFHPQFNGLPGPHLGGDVRTHGPVNKTAAIPDGPFHFFT